MINRFGIYYKDLTSEAKVELLAEFETKSDDEFWDVIPLTIIEREDEYTEEEDEVFKLVDRIEDGRRFQGIWKSIFENGQYQSIQ